MQDLWIGTNNPKKRAELERLLRPLGIRLRVPAELKVAYAPVEDQDTFAGNARKKAELLARLAKGFALADDSGLCVDALGGRPGVQSARYGGPELDDRGRMLRLLDSLAQVAPAQRTAHFACCLCLCGKDGRVVASIEECCHGSLLREPSGEGGFGYDPIFVPREFAGDPTKSFAALDPATKDQLSHRGKALRKLMARLPTLLA
jgi:XTP/dITP diphosphohydrolase